MALTPYVLPVTTGGDGIKRARKDQHEGAINAAFDEVKSRANHTGTQAISTVSGLQAALDSKLEGSLDALTTLTNTADTKATPIDADGLLLRDSTDGFAIRRISWANIKAALKSYFDGFYPRADAAAKVTPIDADIVGFFDSAAASVPKQTTFLNLKAFFKTYFDGLYPSKTIASDRLLGRDTAGTGDLEAISVTGGLAFSGSSQLTMADMPEATFKGRVAGAGTGMPTNMTAAQLRVSAEVPSNATLGLMASGGWSALINQAGTSAITADISAAVPAGWVLRTGQRVQLVAPATTETRPLTLAINGGDAWPIYDNEGVDIPAGAWVQNRTYELRLGGSTGNYAWRLVSGADGRLISALSSKARALDVMGSTDDRDGATPGYVATWRDKDGYMTALDDRGVFHGTGFTIHQFPTDGDDRDYIGETFPMITLGNRVIVGQDPETGEVVAPGLPTGTGYLPPASMRGDWGQFNVRSTTGLTYATVRDLAGDVYDIVQRQSAPTDTAVISSTLNIDIAVGHGQSNAGAATAELGAPIFEESGLPNRVLSLQVEGATGGSSQPATGYDEIFELEAKARGQSPVGCMMHVMAHLDTRANRRGHAHAVTNVWLGGRPIDDFFPGAGQYLYENLMSWTGALHEAAEKYRSAEVKAILWTQGENTQAGYEDLLGDYIDMIRPALRDEVGQAGLPHFLYRMTNRPSNEVGPDANAVDLAQLAVARARLGAGVTMTGAMYHAPLWDTIQVTNLGRLLLAEQDGLAYEHVIRNGEVWHPLWPEDGGITRDGAEIRIPFELPPGAVGTLAWDEDWISPVTDKGFHYVDDSSGATVSSVEIDGLDVVVTLSADPGAATGKTISYARRGLTRLDGWAAARGQLYAPTRKRSVFAELGYPIPDDVRLYAVKFQEVIS